MSEETAVAKHKPTAVEKIRDVLAHNSKRLAEIASKGMDVAQLEATALQQVALKTDLLKCSPHSVVAAIGNAATLNLRLDPQLRLAALVPRWDKKAQRNTCHLWVMAAGWIQLAKRTGKVSTFAAHAVREGDLFEWEYGTNEFLRHKPLDEDDRPIVAAYAIATFANGHKQFVVINRSHIEKLRNLSGNPDGPFWRIWYAEMAEAKAAKILTKKLEIETDRQELHRAVTIDDQMDANVVQTSALPELQENGQGAPASIEEAAEQIVENAKAPARAVEKKKSALNEQWFPTEVKQRVHQAAIKAGVGDNGALNALLELQREIQDRQASKQPFSDKALSQFLHDRVNGIVMALESIKKVDSKANPKDESPHAGADAGNAGKKPAADPENPWLQDVGDPPPHEDDDEPPPPDDLAGLFA